MIILPKPTFTDVSQLPLSMTMDHVAQVLGIARSSAYELAKQVDFPVLQVKNRLIVPRDAFFRWVERKSLEKEETA